MRKSMVKKSRSNKTLREIMKIYGFGLFFTIVVIIVAYQFVEPAPPKTLTIATASSDGAYFSFANEYKKYFTKEEIELKVLETSGSVENLQLLKDRKVEVAFLQGGVGDAQQFPDAVGLASLYEEPLIIFVRKGVQISTLADFAGKKIAAGEEGSGTRKIVQQLLDDNELGDSDGITLVPLGGKAGASELLAGNIDALFMVIRADAEIVQELFLIPSRGIVQGRTR